MKTIKDHLKTLVTELFAYSKVADDDEPVDGPHLKHGIRAAAVYIEAFAGDFDTPEPDDRPRVLKLARAKGYEVFIQSDQVTAVQAFKTEGMDSDAGTYVYTGDHVISVHEDAVTVAKLVWGDQFIDPTKAATSESDDVPVEAEPLSEEQAARFMELTRDDSVLLPGSREDAPNHYPPGGAPVPWQLGESYALGGRVFKVILARRNEIGDVDISSDGPTVRYTCPTEVMDAVAFAAKHMPREPQRKTLKHPTER